MNRFLVGEALTAEIEAILKSPGSRYAVAFWGRGSTERLPDGGKGNVKIICNLRSGGTNPAAIKAMNRENVRQMDDLHAKVYLGSDHAVVTSANASANGLGFEGHELKGWREAGWLTDEIRPIADWFEVLWSEAHEISDQDIRLAEEAWRKRQRAKPTLRDFADFDPHMEQVPLLYWIRILPWEYEKESIKKQMGSADRNVLSLVDNSLEVDNKKDEDTMVASTVLVWTRTGGHRVDRRSRPYWFRAGRVLRKCFSYEGYPRDAILPSEEQVIAPFLLTDEFIGVFRETLEQSEFDLLRSDHTEGPWYTQERLNLHRRFWSECHNRYVASTATE
ncbi:phospholipase D family protein [Faunimonas sp. B44]|uniref:phospholipase D family protein n=1 Tax=Faunimonas sp. B44 TaxID=3461493 RepID=UPI004044FECE